VNDVGPHGFHPQGLLGWRRCRHCYLPRDAHPVHCWVPSRPLGDKTPAALTWENLHGPDAGEGEKGAVTTSDD